MSRNHTGLGNSKETDTSARYGYINFVQKPIEIYLFVDPLCPECWSLEPYLRKLSIEYGRFFTIRFVLTGYLSSLTKEPFDQPKRIKDIWERTAKRTGMSCDGDLWLENPISAPWVASLAIKAAELQGKKAGRVFLRKIQENLFLKKKNITDETVLMLCAEEAKLDIQEFVNDLHSASAKKALQSDFKLTKEMEVDYIPSMVFFNQRIDDQGVKISGLYPYEIYVRIMSDILNKVLIPSEKPPLADFISFYEVIGSKEIAVVYDWTEEKAEREMKKLQLKRVVEKIPVKYGSFWRYKY